MTELIIVDPDEDNKPYFRFAERKCFSDTYDGVLVEGLVEGKIDYWFDKGDIVQIMAFLLSALIKLEENERV